MQDYPLLTLFQDELSDIPGEVAFIYYNKR
jgi:hypothetical protein